MYWEEWVEVFFFSYFLILLVVVAVAVKKIEEKIEKVDPHVAKAEEMMLTGCLVY